MKRTKQILTLFLSVLMIFSTISMAFASEKKETCREDSIQLIEESIGNDLSHNYVIEESVVIDEGVEWTRVDVYSVDENGVRAAIGYAEYSWFVSNRTGGIDGNYTLTFQWRANILMDVIYVTGYCLTTSTGRVVAAGDTTINAHGTAYGTRTVGMYWGGAGVERMYMDPTRIEGVPMDTSSGSVFTASFRQVIDVN